MPRSRRWAQRIWRQRAPYRLSGGEKRAVAIAGVLAMEPSILVLDEPSSGLDPAGRRRLIGLLRSFTQTRVIATHDLDLVLEVCAARAGDARRPGGGRRLTAQAVRRS